MGRHGERTLESGEVEGLGSRSQRDSPLDRARAETEPRDVLRAPERKRRVDLVADHRYVIRLDEGHKRLEFGAGEDPAGWVVRVAQKVGTRAASKGPLSLLEV